MTIRKQITTKICSDGSSAGSLVYVWDRLHAAAAALRRDCYLLSSTPAEATHFHEMYILIG